MLLVSRNRGGKTEYLNRLAERNPDALYFSIREKGDLAGRILAMSGMDSNEKLEAFLKENYPSAIARSVLERGGIRLLQDAGQVRDISYRRALMLAMICRYGTNPGMVLIDEPELLAHPLLRKEIEIAVQALQRKGYTLVIATNSDNIVEDLATKVCQVVRLRDDGKMVYTDTAALAKKVKSYYHEDIRLLRRFSNADQADYGLRNIVDNLYEEYLGSALTDRLFDLMFAESAIVGEGASEGILFDYVDKIVHPDWVRQHSVAFVSCLGKATMPLYFLYLNELGIRVVCMHDRDKESNPVHRAFHESFSRYQERNPSLFWEMTLAPDLEGVLHISPSYRLESIEKPVNVYLHTYMGSRVKTELNAMMDTWRTGIEEMESHG